MRVLFLVNSFPSENSPSKGIFNLRAADQLKTFCDLKIVRFKSWIPGKPFKCEYDYNGHRVLCIYLPRIPLFKNSIILRLNIIIRRTFGYILLPEEYKLNISIVHAIQLTANGPVGSYWAKKMDSHSVVQCIGSDVNYDLKKYNKESFKNFLGPIKGLVCNSFDLFKKVSFLVSEQICAEVIYRGVIFFPDNQKTKLNNEDCFTFLFLGGFWSYPKNKKGELSLLRAIEICQPKLENRNIKFLIGGQNSISKKLDDWKNSLQFPGTVKFMGELKPESVFGIIKASDTLIIPSPAEGLPNTLLEASVQGTPCIASNIGGIPEVIDNLENGVLINPGDEQDLANAIIWCINNDNSVKEFGRKIQKKVKDNFDGTNYGERLIQFYKKIIN